VTFYIAPSLILLTCVALAVLSVAKQILANISQYKCSTVTQNSMKLTSKTVDQLLVRDRRGYFLARPVYFFVYGRFLTTGTYQTLTLPLGNVGNNITNNCKIAFSVHLVAEPPAGSRGMKINCDKQKVVVVRCTCHIPLHHISTHN